MNRKNDTCGERDTLIKSLRGKTVQIIENEKKGVRVMDTEEKQNTGKNKISLLTVPWGNKEHVKSKSAHQNHHRHKPSSKVYLCTAIPVS